jgi:adenylosuccinate lyase
MMSQENSLLAISPIDGRYAQKTAVLNPYMSEYALFRYRLWIEIQWFIHLAHHAEIPEIPHLSELQTDALINLFHHFSLEDAKEIKALESVTNHDVKAVEYFLKSKMKNIEGLSPYIEYIHFACTSEDINNLAYALMFKACKDNVLLPYIDGLIEQLRVMCGTYAEQPMLSRTHGQAASPTTLGKEISNFVFRLQNARESLNKTLIRGKINGAVGNFNAHLIAYPDINWLALSQHFVEALGLTWNPYSTQIENHDYLSEHFTHITRFNQILVDFSRDIWGYIALGYFSQHIKENEVGSSTMPHKVNPIDFENAEGNLLLANAHLLFLSQQLLTSRWQRDLVDSTLMRNMGVGLAYSLIAYQSLEKGLQKIIASPDKLASDLNDHWEILGEAIQTVMRRYGLPEPYEQLKALTRGEKITPEILAEFIQSLPLPQPVKNELLSLTPENYLGNAVDMAKKMARQCA